MIKLRLSVIHHSGEKATFGDSIRVTKILESLQKQGIHTSNVRLPSIKRDDLREYENLRTVFSNLFPPHKSNSLKLKLTRKAALEQIELSVSLNYLVRTLRRLKPDVLLAETSKVGWITAIIAKKLSVPCITDVHGLVFAEAKGWKHIDWQRTMNQEREAFENGDHLIVVSEKMKEYISRKFKIPNNKMTVAPNGGSPQKSVGKYTNPLRIIYAGVFSYWEKIDDFLDVAKVADQKAFKFYLAGAGPERNQLIKRINDEKIPVNYLGYVPKQRIHRLLAQMQVGIAPSTDDLARQVASPIKIFDYMASGLPVVTPKIGDWGDIIEKENCGIALRNPSIDNYLQALNTLALEETWTRMAWNAVKAIETKYSWDRVLQPLADLVKSLCN